MIIQPSTCSPPSERSVLTALRIKVHTSRPMEHTRPRLLDDESGRKCGGTRANSVLRSGARTSYLCPNQTLTLTNVASGKCEGQVCWAIKADGACFEQYYNIPIVLRLCLRVLNLWSPPLVLVFRHRRSVG